MVIGPLFLSPNVVVFVVSIAVAMFAGALVHCQRTDVESAIAGCVLFGLVVARLAFVADNLPSYGGDLTAMLDVRDMGFRAGAGLTAGALMLLAVAVRRADARRPLLTATMAGVVAWSVGFAAFLRTPATAPTVPSNLLVDAHGIGHPLMPRDGKPLVVNLWASWCGPCRDEMPVLAHAQAENSHIDLVLVNQGETAAAVQAFLDLLGLHSARSLLDPQGALAASVGVVGYPTTLFYDDKGRLLEKHSGKFSRATFEEKLRQLYPMAMDAKS